MTVNFKLAFYQNPHANATIKISTIGTSDKLADWTSASAGPVFQA